MELELGLDPADAARLPRLAILAPLRTGRARSRATRIVWHDGLDGALENIRKQYAEQLGDANLEDVFFHATSESGAPPKIS